MGRKYRPFRTVVAWYCWQARAHPGAGKEIGIYSAPRSIIDASRLQHHEGIDLANEALKRWLRQGGQPSELLRMARSFPHAQRALRQTRSILV